MRCARRVVAVAPGDGWRRGLLAVALGFALVLAAAAAAAEPARAASAASLLPARGDVAGTHAARPSPRASRVWRQGLAGAQGAHVAARAFRAQGSRSAIVTWVAITGTPQRAAQLERTLAHRRHRRWARAAALALRRRPRQLGRARRRVWRLGRAVGEVVVAGWHPRQARRALAVVAGLERRRAAYALQRTAWQRVLGGVGPGGGVSVRTAEQAFSLAIAPLPGVRVPRGRVGRIADGTIALRWLVPRLDRLPARVRTAARRALARLRPGGPAAPRAGGATVRAHAATWKPDQHYQAMAAADAAAIGSRLGIPLALTLEVGRGPLTDKTADADTGVYGPHDSTSTGPPVSCVITIGPMLPSRSGFEQRQEVAHEVFHCFQGQIVGLGRYWSGAQAWLFEGGANWADCELYPSTTVGATDWEESYLLSPEYVLFARTYSGMGFFSHLLERGVDVWHAMPGILLAGGNELTFTKAITGHEDDVLDTWASGYFRNSARGPAWDTHGPCTGGQAPPPELATVTNGVTAPETAAPYTNLIALAFLDSDLVHVTGAGHVRLSDGHTDTTHAVGGWFCTRLSDRCQCPPGSDPIAPSPPQLQGGQADLALTGGHTGAHVKLTGVSLHDFCRPKPEPPGNPGAGAAFGDPHLITFDGLAYDFQAIGEFVAARSPRGDLEIQVRQQQVPDALRLQLGGQVSMNTAVAMRAGGHRVGVYATGLHSPPAVRLDGRSLPGHRGARSLGGGATLRRSGTSVTVRWPDGTVADVQAPGRRGGLSYGPWLDLVVRASPARRGTLRGLLGDDGGRQAGDLRPRGGGSPVDPSDFHALYRRFGDSWRIRQSQSLFDYPRGKSTRSYTRRDFPQHRAEPGGLGHLLRAIARRACRAAGVQAGPLLRGCTLDVGATGDRLFAHGAAQVQHTIAAAAGGGPGPAPAAPIALGAGSFPHVAVDSAGNAYVTWEQEHGATFTFHYCKLRPGTRSCAASLTVPGPAVGSYQGGYALPIGGGRVLLLLVHGVAPDIAKDLWTSTDGGATFTGPVAVGTLTANGDNAEGAALYLPAGTLGLPANGVLTISANESSNNLQATGTAAGAFGEAAINPALGWDASVALAGAGASAHLLAATSDEHTISLSHYAGPLPATFTALNTSANWSAPAPVAAHSGANAEVVLASGPAGAYLMYGRASDGAYAVQPVAGGAATTVTTASADNGDLAEDPSGRLGLAYRKGTDLIYRHTTDLANRHWSTPQRVAGAGTFGAPQVALDAHGDGWIVFDDGVNDTVGAVSVTR